MGIATWTKMVAVGNQCCQGWPNMSPQFPKIHAFEWKDHGTYVLPKKMYLEIITCKEYQAKAGFQQRPLTKYYDLTTRPRVQIQDSTCSE